MKNPSACQWARQPSVRLRFVFSFLLGCVTMATLLSVAWLETGQCSTSSGTVCSGPGHRLRRVFSVLNGIISSSTVDRAVDCPSDTTGSIATEESSNPPSPNLSSSATATSTSKVWHRLLSTNIERDFPTSKPILARRQPLTRLQDQQAQRHLNAARNILLAKKQASIKPRDIPSDLVPDLYFGRHTFPTPADAPLSMEERINTPCNRTNLCLEYLSHSEMNVYTNCSTICEEKKHKFGSAVPGACRFMNGSGRLPVALASFPGSGNTWVRGLLEKITGICTG